jgi:hypothetical protein
MDVLLQEVMSRIDFICSLAPQGMDFCTKYYSLFLYLAWESELMLMYIQANGLYSNANFLDILNFCLIDSPDSISSSLSSICAAHPSLSISGVSWARGFPMNAPLLIGCIIEYVLQNCREGRYRDSNDFEVLGEQLFRQHRQRLLSDPLRMVAMQQLCVQVSSFKFKV